MFTSAVMFKNVKNRLEIVLFTILVKQYHERCMKILSTDTRIRG
jgi:hypothetical protein